VLEQELHIKALAAPAVRWRARERGVALSEVKASGTQGRITHSDLDNYLLDTSVNITRSAQRAETVDEVPVVGMRRQIARQMELASRRIPHFSYIEELDVTELESLRHTLAETASEDNANMSPLPFVVMAIVRSLENFPAMNAHYDDEAGIVRVHSGRHVGIATHTEKGLMVPVVRHAERLSIYELAAEISRLALAARSGRITREELEGGTITVTSLGALGGLASTPIINHPEVAIVGVNRIVTRVVCCDEQIVKRQMMNLSSSFDHRVVDGHDAAHFIQRVRTYIECPATLFIRN
jgi:2-oxoisovalerate dehydrogenase E2 component (dihydrolipoyl transacylase)